MENHPIPQDITGFQFKLIGNMTIRQFVYLAIGAILAWLFFFMLGLPAIVKWPLSIFSIGAGAIFAFVPIDGRPMDQMLSNFIKAIMSPTQFVYQKQGMKVENENLPKSQPLHLPHLHRSHQDDAPVSGIQNTPSQQPNLAQMQVTTPVTQPVQTPPPPPMPVAQIPTPTPAQQAPAAPQPAPEIKLDTPLPPPPPMPTNIGPITATMTIEPIEDSHDLKMKNRELDDLKDDNKKLSEELERLKKELEDAKKAKEEALKNPSPEVAPIVQAPPELTPEQKELQKQQIEAEREKIALQQQFLQEQAKAQAPTQGVAPTIATNPTASQRVRSIAPGMERAAGIPSIPEAPNLITGIVKDPRGNPLQSILIEVKDQDANPVRAFKTNGLGKFASATSLSNGKYLITFEDPKEVNKFDAVEIELIGAPVMPLEIISVDPREELRRELFK